MRIIHRLTQYERLYQKFGDHPVATTVADVASLLFCSERHARTLIQQLQMKSWLSWHSQVGRGKRAQLQCLKNLMHYGLFTCNSSLSKAIIKRHSQ